MTDTRPPRAGTLLPLGWWKDPRWQIPPLERDLFTRLLSYSADLLTDGWIPASIVGMLAFVSAGNEAEAAVGLVTDLRGRGLLDFDRAADGFVIPPDAYAIFNLTAADIEAMKAMKAEAGRKRAENARRDPVTKRYLPARAGSGAGSRAGSKSQQASQQKASPTPVSRLPSPVGARPSRTPSREAGVDKSVGTSTNGHDARTDRHRSEWIRSIASYEITGQAAARAIVDYAITEAEVATARAAL